MEWGAAFFTICIPCFIFYIIVDIYCLRADEKKKDCEKDIGRVEMMEGESSKTKRAAVFNDPRSRLISLMSLDR
jgi:hypothetical protein